MIDKYYNVYKHYSNFNQHGFDLQIRIVARAIRQEKKVLHRKLNKIVPNQSYCRAGGSHAPTYLNDFNRPKGNLVHEGEQLTLL